MILHWPDIVVLSWMRLVNITDTDNDNDNDNYAVIYLFICAGS